MPLLILAAALATAGAGELFRLARARGLRPSPLVGLAGIFALLLVAHARGEKAPPFFPAVLAGVLGACFVAMIARRRRTEVTRAIAYTVLPVVWVGVLAAYVLALRGTAGGFRLVLVLIAMVVGSEAGTWLAARIEREPSPDVVSRALLGGLIAAATVAIVAALSVPKTFSWGTALVLAVLDTVSARAGKMAGAMIEHDLFGAARARASLLRRIDGVLLSAPVFYYGFRALAR
jgi:predicted CDP-diglyceride synthetase/phosphatidate cytidylyltransferase